ncbi:MAG TPA: PadR family transcriptional regulator [Candidatus Dormibacteraeota bacterium]|nr:PadR family transcriptional regulator [Candidatus Dormibacteraeota bacterium]
MVKIGPLAVAVLGLLAEEPRHPYDIAYTMQTRRMNEHIKLSMGTLYHVVEQLQRLGWIEPTETAREGRRPERTIYALTADGRRQLQDRVRQLIAEPTREYSSFEAGLTFMHQLAAEEAAMALRRRAQALREQIELWDYALDQLCHRGLSRLALIEVEMIQDARAFQRDWALRIANEIDEGSIEWETHTRDRDGDAVGPSQSEEVTN